MGSKNRKTSVDRCSSEPSKNSPSLPLSIGLRSIGPEELSPTAVPSDLPDSLRGESTLKWAGESTPADKAECSPSIEPLNASSQQVLSIVTTSTSRHTLHFLPKPVLHIQAPSFESIVEWNLHLPMLQSPQKKEHECKCPS